MELQHNVVGWFELPVDDMNRAIAFYEGVFGFKMERHQMGELDMGWFPSNHQASGAMGSLVKHPDFYIPSHDGPLIYFTAHSGDLDIELAKVESAGGTVLMPKKQISQDVGFMALIEDTEGNRVALHSRA